jgi:hypothetical protein
LAQRFQDVVTMGNLRSELAEAFAHCQNVYKVTPAGKSASNRELATVSLLLKERPSSGILFSGSLGQLALAQQATPQMLDTGRIAKLFAEARFLSALGNPGPILVNSGAADGGFRRCNKDAEVCSLALVAYWHKGAVKEQLDAINALLTDLVFEMRTCFCICPKNHQNGKHARLNTSVRLRALSPQGQPSTRHMYLFFWRVCFMS